MILFLMDFLKEWTDIRVPAVFGYYSTRMMLAVLTSLLCSILLGPCFIRKLYEMKIGQTIRKEDCPLLGQLHEKKENTPTMGGALILFSMLMSMFIWMDWTHIFTLLLLVTTICLGMVGGVDDYLKLKYKNTRGLSAKWRLTVEALFSVLIAGYLLWTPLSQAVTYKNWFTAPIIKDTSLKENGYNHEKTEMVSKTLSLHEYAARLYLPFFKEPILLFHGFAIAFIGLWICFVIIGSSNAVNLTDGLDGLASGCLIMVAGTFAIIAFVSNHVEFARYLNILYIEGSGEIAIYLCAMIGACLGFLWYNSHPAQIFMGDIGSLALGGIIGVSAVLLRREFLLGIVGGIFVIEALSVIMQVGSYRLRNKKRIFLCAPLHHHFEYKGWAETKIVIRFWIISLLLAIIGVGSLKFQ